MSIYFYKATIFGREACIEVDTDTDDMIAGISLSTGCGRRLDIDRKDMTDDELRVVQRIVEKLERVKDS